MKIKIVVLATLIAAIMLGGMSQAVMAKGGGDKTRIALSPSAQYPSAKGKADYKVDGGEREFEVEVENVKSLAGKSLKVFVNGSKVGSMTVNSFGEARLNLNTDRGQAVPNIVPGARVKVKTGGVLVVSGRF